MANKITFTSTVTLARADGNIVLKGTFSRTQTGTHYTAEAQTVGITDEALDFGPDIGTIFCVLVKNLDPANFIEIATDTAMTKNVCVIRAGEAAPIFPKAGDTLYAKADTAPVEIEFLAIQI